MGMSTHVYVLLLIVHVTMLFLQHSVPGGEVPVVNLKWEYLSWNIPELRYE